MIKLSLNEATQNHEKYPWDAIQNALSSDRSSKELTLVIQAPRSRGQKQALVLQCNQRDRLVCEIRHQLSGGLEPVVTMPCLYLDSD